MDQRICIKCALCNTYRFLWVPVFQASISKVNDQSWIMYHNNVPAHTSLLVRNFWLITTPYSPDLAPCNLFLFPKLKRPMKGRRFATIEKIKTASPEELKTIPKSSHQKCFKDWKKLAQVYYIWGGFLWRGQYRYWWINKYFSRKIKIHIIFSTAYILCYKPIPITLFSAY